MKPQHYNNGYGHNSMKNRIFMLPSALGFTSNLVRTKRIVLSVLIVAFVSYSFLSCTKDDNQASPNASVPAATLRTIDADYTLRDNETWRGTVSLSARVYVPQGKILTIEAGTKVKIFSGDAGLDIDGSLLIKGTSSSVVRIYAPTISTSRGYDWNGISFYGERLEASYCAISDALIGIDLRRSTTVNTIIINHCLFACLVSIIDRLNSNPVVITNSTFLDNSLEAYRVAGGNKKITMEGCVFDNNGRAIQIQPESSTDTRSTIINITKSNFLRERLDFISTNIAFVPANVSLTLSGCYGLKPSYPIDKSRGSSITITGSVNSPINGIGSGFALDRTARLAAPSLVGE